MALVFCLLPFFQDNRGNHTALQFELSQHLQQRKCLPTLSTIFRPVSNPILSTLFQPMPILSF
jgi:hypothetical protein